MFIRVDFTDNDFSVVVKEACESVMCNISKGYKSEKALELYKENKKKYGIEAIRKAIVLSAYGFYIANKGRESYYLNQEDDVYNVSKHEEILSYLDENISLEEIKNFSQEWENSEVCYIDFFSMEVHLQ